MAKNKVIGYLCLAPLTFLVTLFIIWFFSMPIYWAITDHDYKPLAGVAGIVGLFLVLFLADKGANLLNEK